MTTTTGWRPILDGTERDAALDAVNAIAAALPAPCAIAQPTLAGGNAGLALFHAYLAAHGPGDVARDRAIDHLERATDAIGDRPLPVALYGGFTGISWAAAHLDGRLDGAACELDAIDDALAREIPSEAWTRHYDLISGLVGIGVYALERLPSPPAAAVLAGVVAHLERTAVHTADGITWRTDPALMPDHERRDCPDGYFNFGVAHGIPGVIALLGAASAAGIEPARRLVRDAVAWLLRRRLGEHSPASRFPYWADARAGAAAPGPARVAWCYGDLGIAAALFHAGRATGEPAWEREAIALAVRAAALPADAMGANDALLCHGTAGVAHLFNRLAQASGDPALAVAARRWTLKTLTMRDPGRGIGGFPALRRSDDGATYFWEDDPGLLNGAAGAGLVLLAAATPVEPAWDRLLMVSSPFAPLA